MGVKWNVGLVNGKSGKYLTGEKFGFKIAASGMSLKANQIWTLELDGTTLSLRSPHGRFLSTTEKGVVSCDAESVGKSETFELVPVEGGHFAFKSSHGYFFGGVEDQLSCFSKSASVEYSWGLHLAMHPHVCLRNERRKTYVQLSGGELRLKSEVPWGAESAILLDFDRETARYSLRASNGQYLSADGTMVDVRDAKCQFVLEFHGESIAFRDAENKYLAGVGPNATLKSRQAKVTKDEQFFMEDSHPQVSIVACSNGKRVSCSVRGLEMSASVAEDNDVSSSEIFQLQMNQETKRWALRTERKTYVSSASATLLDNAATADEQCYYDIEWHDTHVTLKTSAGRFVTTKPNGTLAGSGDDAADEKCQYVLSLVNRPVIVLRGPFGFVSTKGEKTSRYECNRSNFEAFGLKCVKGAYQLTGANGKAWAMDSATQTFSPTGSEPLNFHIELTHSSKLLLKAPNGKYLRGESNGMFSATGSAAGKDTLWEY